MAAISRWGGCYLERELRKRIDEFCAEYWPDEEILLFGDGDPCDKGFIGIGYQQHRGPIAVYDRVCRSPG
jgi:hypothetical protein